MKATWRQTLWAYKEEILIRGGHGLLAGFIGYWALIGNILGVVSLMAWIATKIYGEEKALAMFNSPEPNWKLQCTFLGGLIAFGGGTYWLFTRDMDKIQARRNRKLFSRAA